MQDKLKQLLEPTPVSEIKFRVGSSWGTGKTNNNGKEIGKARMLAYVDARYVMDKLDAVVGPDGWRDEYKEVRTSIVKKERGSIVSVHDVGKLYCGISILIDGKWVTKWDVGVQSNIEKEKGEASDSFKRSAVKWGIGRDLYSMGNFEAETAIKTKVGKWWVSPDWKPKYNKEGIPWDVSDMRMETPPHKRKEAQLG